jgi:hypothetical protein
MPANKQLETGQLVKLENGGCCFQSSFYYSEIHTFQACFFFFLISLFSNYEGEGTEIQVETKEGEYK